MNIMDILKGASQDREEEDHDNRTLMQRVKTRRESATSAIDWCNRFEALISDIGEERVNRLMAFLDGKDPDKPKSVMKVGPHGPGCECVLDEEGLLKEDDDCPTTH